MCIGFGMIVSKDMHGYFTMPDKDGDMSHSEILDALGWKDNINTHLRNFVRMQCAEWKIKSFEFDEERTLPGWVEENREEIIGIVKKALRKCAPAWAEYEKVRATARAEYDKVCDTAWAEYEKVRATARAEYGKVRDTAWAKYKKVCATARTEYDKVCAPAWARFHDRLAKISGFVELT